MTDAVWVACLVCDVATEQPPHGTPSDVFGDWAYEENAGWVCGRCARLAELEREVGRLQAKYEGAEKAHCSSCDRVTSRYAADAVWEKVEVGWRCPMCQELVEVRVENAGLRVQLDDALEAEKVLQKREQWAATVLSTRLHEVRGLRVGPNDGPIESILDDKAPGVDAGGDRWDRERAFQATGPRLALFAHVMAWELRQNAHKGDWRNDASPDLAEDLLYHAAKLAIAVDEGDLPAVLEYAADCGLLAMIVADRTGALAVEHMSPPGASELYQERPYSEKLTHARGLAADWVLAALQQTARQRQVRRALAATKDVKLDSDGVPVVPF